MISAHEKPCAPAAHLQSFVSSGRLEIPRPAGFLPGCGAIPCLRTGRPRTPDPCCRFLKGHMMRSLLALLTTLVLAACSAAPAARDQPHPQNASVKPEVESLLTWAATDFHTNRGSYPARFRNVRSGYFVMADGSKQYRLCGEFQPAQG